MLDELTRHATAAWLAELAETYEPSTIATRLRGCALPRTRGTGGWGLGVLLNVGRARTLNVSPAPGRPTRRGRRFEQETSGREVE